MLTSSGEGSYLFRRREGFKHRYLRVGHRKDRGPKFTLDGDGERVPLHTSGTEGSGYPYLHQ